MQLFSERHGHSKPDAEICVRNDAPDELREVLVVICYKVGMKPSVVRTRLCDLFLKAPNRNNWSEYPNIDFEVRDLIRNCEWFEVYDAIEAIYAYLVQSHSFISDYQATCVFFEEQINRYFRGAGIGWVLVNGNIEMRGSEAFELAVRQGRDELWSAGKQTAATELHEAIRDLSRRPSADLTGAIQHAMAALECVAREKCESKDTLGDLIRRNPNIFPKPIDTIVDKAWGWTSNNGRHLTENGQPSFDEAELMVGISGVLCRYLSRKL